MTTPKRDINTIVIPPEVMDEIRSAGWTSPHKLSRQLGTSPVTAQRVIERMAADGICADEPMSNGRYHVYSDDDQKQPSEMGKDESFLLMVRALGRDRDAAIAAGNVRDMQRVAERYLAAGMYNNYSGLMDRIARMSRGERLEFQTV